MTINQTIRTEAVEIIMGRNDKSTTIIRNTTIIDENTVEVEWSCIASLTDNTEIVTVN